MAGEGLRYYDPITGTTFYVPTAYNQLSTGQPFAIPMNSVTPPVPTPQLAPLGSLQNPYPAGTVALPLARPPEVNPPQRTYTRRLNTPLAPQTQSYGVQLPVQQFQPPPLLHRCCEHRCFHAGLNFDQPEAGNAAECVQSTPWNSWLGSEADKGREMVMTQEQNQEVKVPMSWRASAQIASLAAEHACSTRKCGYCLQPVGCEPSSNINAFPFPLQSSTTSQHQPSPQHSHHHLNHPSIEPFPPALLSHSGATPRPSQSMIGSDPQYPSWPTCQICTSKAAIREMQGVLFCLACYVEAEEAESARARG